MDQDWIMRARRQSERGAWPGLVAESMRCTSWLAERESMLTVVGAACAFVVAFATTWVAIQR